MCIECPKNYVGFVWKNFVSHKACSVRKKLAFHDATTGFPPKCRLRNERRNSILKLHLYPDLGKCL